MVERVHALTDRARTWQEITRLVDQLNHALSDRDALSAIPPRAGISDPPPSTSVRGRQILANRDLRGTIELDHRACLRSRSVEGAGAGNASQ
jgi:hypothetical protein